MSALANKQFILDGSGKPVAVLLDLATYERLCAAAEEAADVHAFDEAMPQALRELKACECVDLEQYLTDRRSQ
jgi:hypothetical protein